MKVELFIVCDHAMISKSGKLNIIGIFDRLVAKKIPGVYPNLYLAAMIKGKSEEEAELELIISDPKGTEVVRKELNLKLGINGKSNLVISLSNFKLPSAGKYLVELYFDGQKGAEKELAVQLKQEKKKLPN